MTIRSAIERGDHLRLAESHSQETGRTEESSTTRQQWNTVCGNGRTKNRARDCLVPQDTPQDQRGCPVRENPGEDIDYNLNEGRTQDFNHTSVDEALVEVNRDGSRRELETSSTMARVNTTCLNNHLLEVNNKQVVVRVADTYILLTRHVSPLVEHVITVEN